MMCINFIRCLCAAQCSVGEMGRAGNTADIPEITTDAHNDSLYSKDEEDNAQESESGEMPEQHTEQQLQQCSDDQSSGALKHWRSQHRLAYIQELESRAPRSKLAPPGSRLPPNLQPSQLQPLPQPTEPGKYGWEVIHADKLKVCAGSNRLSQTILPTCVPDGLSFLDTHTDPHDSSSSSSLDITSWQFALLLLNATHVGPLAFGSSLQPSRHVARCCIFDRQHNRFLGNVHTIPVSSIRSHRGIGALGACWTWDSAGPQAGPGPAADGTLSDMCSQQQPHLHPVPPGELVGSGRGIGAAVTAAGEAVARVLGSTLPDSSVGGLGGANACIVRCAEAAVDPVRGVRKLDGERLSLYIELNVSYRLVAEDAAVVPQEEQKGAGLVDELSTCWAMISLKRCAELVSEMTIAVPLYTGSIYEPVLLSAVWAEQRKQHPVRSMLSAAPTPLLTFRAGPLPTQPPPLVPYRLMPPTLIAQRSTAYLLASARQALAQQLYHTSRAQPGDHVDQRLSVRIRAADQPQLSAVALQQDTTDQAAAAAPCHGRPPAAARGLGDAALAALPKLLDDPVLMRELLAKWNARLVGLQQAAEDQARAELGSDCLITTGCAAAAGCSTLAMDTCRPSTLQLLAALRLSVMELAPLLHCSSLPPAHISNFLEHQAHRMKVTAAFCRRISSSQYDGSGDVGGVLDGCGSMAAALRGSPRGRHPVDVLSAAAGEFLHQPFDVAETRVCLFDQLAATKWSRC